MFKCLLGSSCSSHKTVFQDIFICSEKLRNYGRMPVIAGCACRAILFCCLVTGEREALWKHDRKRKREPRCMHLSRGLSKLVLLPGGFEEKSAFRFSEFPLKKKNQNKTKKPHTTPPKKKKRLFSCVSIMSKIIFKPCLKLAPFGSRNVPFSYCVFSNTFRRCVLLRTVC